MHLVTDRTSFTDVENPQMGLVCEWPLGYFVTIVLTIRLHHLHPLEGGYHSSRDSSAETPEKLLEVAFQRMILRTMSMISSISGVSMAMRFEAMMTRTSSTLIGMSSAILAQTSGCLESFSFSAKELTSCLKMAESVLIPPRFSLAAHSAWKRATFCS
uniref:Uncharacterized protein n=1 Tax=uncultured marine microorganism HF4000_ANIW133F6 TaxID=455529 RepID=B3T3V2_9ZZZZ|nr:hypothetical protein ALOHA_HF4000ANIW133F6ctg1g11 [uncultured marine microorganism HF4000_ANIW133F6]